MMRLFIQRLLTFPLLLLSIYAAAVFLIMATPGDPLDTGDRELSADALQSRRIAYNYLERLPTGEIVEHAWWKRYFWTWPKRLIWDHDLPAHQYPDWTVYEIMRSALPVSMQLGVFAFTLAVILGVSAGALSALQRGRWLDHGALGLSLIGISLPTFVVGAALLILFAFWLRVAPVGGWGSPAQVILPAITLALPYAAYIARLTRSALLDAYAEDYVRTARAKGLSESRVLFDHALRNAMLPVLSYLGPAAAAIFTGSFVIEKIFSVPGMGTHVVESINNRDRSLILATVLVYSVFLASFNLVVDLLYAVVDPRIRVGGAAG